MAQTFSPSLYILSDINNLTDGKCDRNIFDFEIRIEIEWFIILSTSKDLRGSKNIIEPIFESDD